MGIDFAQAPTRNRLTRTSPAGIYQSARGTTLLKPSSGGTTRRGAPTPTDSVVILKDCDSGRSFIKKIDQLKGEYTFVCGEDDVNLVRKNANHF